jgi:transcriptional regulator with XRE-family HTH domain
MSTGESTPVGLSALIGRNLRRLRKEGLGQGREVNQYTCATLLQAYGLGWERSQLAKAERGERVHITVEQLVLIAAALNVPLVELVRCEPGERIVLSDETTCDAEFLLPMFEGAIPPETRSREHIDAPFGREVVRDFEEGKAFTIFKPAPNETEEKIALALDVSPELVVNLSPILWNLPVEDERERRLAERLGGEEVPTSSLSARRGHITRELTEELRRLLETFADAFRAVERRAGGPLGDEDRERVTRLVADAIKKDKSGDSDASKEKEKRSERS